ncbi:MAG: hypothetical protein AAGG53_17670 [Cyanobacteria bacterium P01_H01_bin.152]
MPEAVYRGLTDPNFSVAGIFRSQAQVKYKPLTGAQLMLSAIAPWSNY